MDCSFIGESIFSKIDLILEGPPLRKQSEPTLLLCDSYVVAIINYQPVTLVLKYGTLG